jgi:D-glycero-alpha-D-manno-heptose 1-phosphate guanylyltransferase
LIVNGDTLYKADVNALFSSHHKNDADCTLSLKPMENFNRYGVVEINTDNVIINFKEKQFYETGLINGGVYILNAERLLSKNFSAKFSFEKDFLEKECRNGNIYGIIKDEYFIDIGVPEDYKKAQEELKYIPPDLKKIDKSWTLFIDRDGVINHEKQNDYIRNWREFQFYERAKEALKILAAKFGKIIVVSNQRGVGKELMTEADLSSIHQHMQKQIETAGGHIDKIFYCTSTDTRHPERKPNPGMALKAKKEIPSIDLSKSIMVGNNSSDMLFGRNAGLYTIFLKTTRPDQPLPHPDIDLAFDSLINFAKAL